MGEGRETAKRHEEMAQISIRVVIKQVYMFIKTNLMVHIKWMHFIVYKLHLNGVDF